MWDTKNVILKNVSQNWTEKFKICLWCHWMKIAARKKIEHSKKFPWHIWGCLRARCLRNFTRRNKRWVKVLEVCFRYVCHFCFLAFPLFLLPQFKHWQVFSPHAKRSIHKHLIYKPLLLLSDVHLNNFQINFAKNRISLFEIDNLNLRVWPGLI